MTAELLDSPTAGSVTIEPAPAPASTQNDDHDADLTNVDRAAILADFSPEKLRWNNIDWVVVAWIVGMHLGCLAAPFFFTWQAAAVALVLHWLTCSIGICLGYHRGLSHRSLKLVAPVRFFTTLCGVLSGEGSPLTWAATHRRPPRPLRPGRRPALPVRRHLVVARSLDLRQTGQERHRGTPRPVRPGPQTGPHP